jgi:hypothetical protein
VDRTSSRSVRMVGGGLMDVATVVRFIVDLRRTYKSRRGAGIPCAIDGYEGVVRGAQAGQQNSFDQRLQLQFREWCADGGGRDASLRVPMSGLQ